VKNLQHRLNANFTPGASVFNSGLLAVTAA